MSDAEDSTQSRAQRAKKRTRIQIENEVKILDAALETFAAFGFRGTTVDQIAEKAGMSKPNLLYYYRRKHDIYRAVLERTLDTWLAPLVELDPDGDPIGQITAYLRGKLELSRTSPLESRLFASEILQGAPQILDVLTIDLKAIVEAKAKILQRWMSEGHLRQMNPYHLIFMFWATTQHYADFDAQVRSVLGAGLENDIVRQDADATLMDLILNGIQPK